MPTTLRLLTYNVRSMRDDREALARVIRSAQADVVCVQEAPRFLRWRSLCAQLARTAGLVVVGGGRPAAANLILSALRVDVLATANALFTKDPGLHRRGAAIARLRVAGVEFAVAGTHLDLREGPRLRHVAELEQALARHVPAGVPAVVAGDVNDRPGSPTWTAVAAGRTDAFAVAGTGSAFTSTAAEPHQTIDGIFAGPGVQVISARVLDQHDVELASDHRPLLAELVVG